jgi:signal transduction histidine kinase
MTPGAAIGGWVAAALALAGTIHARRALATRLELIARACHELRGPITAARLGLELGARPGGLSSARLRAVDLELRRATLAIDDLSAVRAGRRSLGRYEVVDVRSLLVDLVEARRAAAELRGCSLELIASEDLAAVFGNRLRLAQAVGNLIENAIEHGGGAVEVRLAGVGLTEGRGDEVGACRDACEPARIRVEFIDDGPGLPSPVADLVRGSRHNRARHGHGLAVAAEVAIAHGGHLGAAPSERGARLVMELPAVAEETRATASG